MKCMAVGVCMMVAVGASMVFGKECVWTGKAGDHDYGSAGNWSDNAVPAAGDTIVFNQEGETLVTVSQTLANLWGGARFEKGHTVFGFPAGVSKANVGFVAPTATLWIAPEASVVISNRLCTTAAGFTLTIDGGGDLKLYSDMVDNVGYFDMIDVKAGTVTYLGGGGEGGWIWLPRETVVRDGATLKFDGVTTTAVALMGHKKYPSFRVEEGGTMDWHSSSGSIISSVCGEGKIRIGGVCSCTFTLDQGPVSFAGEIEYYAGAATWNVSFVNMKSMAADVFKYLLAAEDAFKGVAVSDAGALCFSPAVDTYRIGSWKGSETEPNLLVQATNGAPVTVVLNAIDASARATGPGSVTFVNGGVIKDQIAIDGKLTLLNARKYSLGDGTEAGKINLLTVSEVQAGEGAEVWYDSMTFHQTAPLTGSGTCVFCGYTTFDKFLLRSLYLYVNGTLEAHGGEGLTTAIYYFNASDSKVIAKDGEYVRDYVMKASDPVTSLPYRKGVCCFAPKAKRGELVVDAGAHFWAEYNGTGEPHLTFNEGGNFYKVDRYYPDATADDPNRITFNGGVYNVSMRDVAYNLTAYPFGDETTPVDVRVGEKPARMRTCESFNFGHTVNLLRPFNPADGISQDGGFTRLVGQGTFAFSKPLNLTGPVALLDGVNRVTGSAADIQVTPNWFGTGSMHLRNSVLSVHGCSAGTAISIASGTGSTLTYEGASTLQFATTSGGDNAKTVTLGGLTRKGAGSVLYVWDDPPVSDDEFFTGTKSRLKVTEAVANQANGVTCQPIVGFWRAANRCLFMRYDATSGEIRKFTDYKKSNDTAGWTTDDIVLLEGLGGAVVPRDAEVSVGGIRLSGYSELLQISIGAVLHVGNGTDPAIVIVDKPSIAGTGGAIDFGTSEGVFCGIGESTIYQPVIRGSAGVTFTAPPYLNVKEYRSARLQNANTYTGGTHVNGIRLEPLNSQAFGTGDVYVGGGQDYGGRIRFESAGLVFANNFHVAGWGKHDLDQKDQDLGYGALDFNASTEISGSVEAVEQARFCAYQAGVVARISGEISGDAVESYCGQGVLEFTHANSYTGGTRIVASTIRISGNGTLGTGGVLLDGGTLAIDKNAAFTLPNRLTGKGTVRLDGKGVVTFAGGLDMHDYNGKVSDLFTLSLGNRSRFVVPTLDGFSAVTTDRTSPIDLYVLDGKPFAGTLPANVTYHAGAYVPTGMSIIIR